MRETCARVLAAALMTGAIATALDLPGEFDSAREPGRGLTAPPSSLQRTVRVPAVTARERPARAERLVTALSIRPSAAGPHQVTNRGLSVTPSNPRPAKAPSAPPALEPEPRELASTTPEAAQPAPGPSPAASTKVEEGQGKKGKGKAKQDAPAAAEAAAPAASDGQATAPPPAERQGETEGQKEHEHGHGHEKEKGHGHGQKD